MPNNIKKYVITGGSSSGKTTIIERLKELGYETIPEAARSIIISETVKSKKKKGYDPILPQTHPMEFQRLVTALQMKLEAKIRISPVFLDRCLADGIAYLEYKSKPVPDNIFYSIKKAGYSKIFFLERLEYQKDNERKENEKEAIAIHENLSQVYSRLEFEVIKIPPYSVDRRIEIILESI